MTHNQLNEYIEHYLDKDKTQSAIMLTGAWGSGKSYYIKHNLIPYLNTKNKDCVVVSLYGIRELKDIGKAIYMELRSIKWLKSNEVTETARIVGKTILKNVAQFVPILDVNMEISKEDLQKLYESVDLSDKLIVFEDIERSNVDIVEFLGYVNNLVEQDGVKVLLVANEKEILTLDTSSEYKSIKEKTVNDTLNFNTDYKEALKNIINLYEEQNINLCNHSNVLNELVNIVENNGGNLRSFIYSCQKAMDILTKIGGEDKELIKIVFLSIVRFSMEYKKTSTFIDDNKEREEEYPLFETCEKYLLNHEIDEADIELLKSDYENYKKQQSALKANIEVSSLKHYYVKEEKEVLEIMKSIETKLTNNNIDLSIYGELAKILLDVAVILNYDTKILQEHLIGNLKGKRDEIKIDTLFIKDDMGFDNSFSEEYLLLKEKMIDALNPETKIFGWNTFDYKPEEVEKFYRVAIAKGSLDMLRETLAKDLKIDKFIKMLRDSTPEQIDKIRSLFWAIYRRNSIILHTEKNNDVLNSLYEEVKELSEQNNLDKIVKFQLEYFMSNLKIFTGEEECNN